MYAKQLNSLTSWNFLSCESNEITQVRHMSSAFLSVPRQERTHKWVLKKKSDSTARSLQKMKQVSFLNKAEGLCQPNAKGSLYALPIPPVQGREAMTVQQRSFTKKWDQQP